MTHTQHQGIIKTKALKKVRWPGITQKIESLIANFRACQVTATPTSKWDPLLMSQIPDNSWDTITLDLKEPFHTSKNILVLIDCRSRFPVVSVLKTTTANTIIKSLLKIFYTFGYSKCITNDNGSQFKSIAFRNFLKQHNIKPWVVTLYWPSANGEVERFNRTSEKPYSALTPKEKTGNKKSKSFYYNIEQHHIPSLTYHQHSLCFAIHHAMIYHHLIPTTNQLKLKNKSTRIIKREKIK